VEGDGRHRLFVALPVSEPEVGLLARWQAAELGARKDMRLVAPSNLHFTLAFLGSRPSTEIEPIVDELRVVAASARRPLLHARAYRETRSVGMVVFEDEGGHAGRLADELAGGLERLGVYERERRPWLPHVTVARFRWPPGLRPEVPSLGEVSPSEVALYTSVLRRTGAQYEIRESVPLGG